MLVSDLMKSNPANVESNATLGVALKKMAEHNCRHLAVVNGANVAGILSDRDLALFYDPASMTEQRWEEGKVSDLMTKNPTTIGSQAPLAEAAKLLVKGGFSALLVVDSGELVGILTESDFVRHFAEQAR